MTVNFVKSNSESEYVFTWHTLMDENVMPVPVQWSGAAGGMGCCVMG